MPPAEITTRDTGILITEGHHQHFDGRTRRIHRVPNLLRYNKEDYYTPKFVSFGPYYHGLPELSMAEEFKHEVLTMFVSSSGKDKQYFYSQIFKVVDQIRKCYSEEVSNYDDEALAEMMLLDASFAIYLIRYYASDYEIYFHVLHHFGMALLQIATQDMFLLENQIPLWVIKLLIKLICGKKEGPMLLCNFLSSFVFGDIHIRLTRFLGEDENPPLHLLGACHKILVEELHSAEERIKESTEPTKQNQSGFVEYNHQSRSVTDLKELDSAEERIKESTELTKQNPSVFLVYNHQYRSVTDLKAKGIRFKPSSSCLNDIKFKSHTFYGQLQLPIWFFSSLSKLFFTHLIAYEVSPESHVGMNITCYVNFLKSLVVKPEDVKELRENKIIFSSLDSDEKILEVIREIDTRGVNADYIFHDVKKRIDKHCSSKAKTWIAQLIHTYFRNPWTSTALVEATFILFLTIIQTYYTMNPPK